MRKLLLAFVLLLLVVACKKNDDLAPDAATAVSGTYQLTLFGQDLGDGAGYKEYVLPFTNASGATISGSITASRSDANTITLTSLLKQTGSADNNQNMGQATLQKNGSSYDMLDKSTKVGTIDGSTIVFDVPTTVTATNKTGRVVLKGKK